ncbi:MAG: IPT/TIG domain-containing protein, partial [Gemmatimonadota bacterium]
MDKRQIRAVWATCALAAVVWACGGDGTGPATGLQPDVLAISPDSGNVGTQVEITGFNFENNATVSFGPQSADSVVVVDATTVLAYAPDGLERDSVYSVSVMNPGGRSDELASAYKAVAPFLQAVNGVSKPSGNNGSTVIFEGKSFGDLLGKGKVYFTDAGG